MTREIDSALCDPLLHPQSRRARWARIVAVGLMLAILAAQSTSCRDPEIDSGIDGTVTIGPIEPVSRPGEDNSSPYQAQIVVKRAADGKVVTSFQTNADGTFHVAVLPGDYVLEPKQGNPFPTASVQSVTVVRGQFTSVRVDYDSGIR